MRCDDEKDEHPLMRAAKWIVSESLTDGFDKFFLDKRYLHGHIYINLEFAL